MSVADTFARMWLEQWVPGYTLGQFAALSELIATLRGPEDVRRPGTYVFVKRGGGEDLDGTPTELYATTLAEAWERARRYGGSIGAEHDYVGYVSDPTSPTSARLEVAMRYKDLPPWAKLRIDQQREDAVEKTKPRRRKGRAA